MGPGEVLIDNVQVYDRWFDENDAKAITQILASAGTLLSKPETIDSCRRLLDGYWVQFLDLYIETGSTSVAASPAISGVRQAELPREQPRGSRPDTDAYQLDKYQPTEVWTPEEKKPMSQMFRRFRDLVPARKPQPQQ